MEEASGEPTFNMSLQTLKRIDMFIMNYHNYKMIGFYKGNPLYQTMLNQLESIYDEVRANLKIEEKKVGDAYVEIFFGKVMFEGREVTMLKANGDLIISNGALIPIMREWVHWLYDMLWSHKMLMAMGEDLGDVIE
jgi:hypothetical protein